MHQFLFEIGQKVAIETSGECGTVIGRGEYQHGENLYLLRYKSAQGIACESWWPESAIVELASN